MKNVLANASAAVATALVLAACGGGTGTAAERTFIWVATLFACRQDSADCDLDLQTSADAIAAGADGTTLVYTDLERPPNRLRTDDRMAAQFHIQAGTILQK